MSRHNSNTELICINNDAAEYACREHSKQYNIRLTGLSAFFLVVSFISSFINFSVWHMLKFCYEKHIVCHVIEWIYSVFVVVSNADNMSLRKCALYSSLSVVLLLLLYAGLTLYYWLIKLDVVNTLKRQ